jgi:hypothetical protein
MALRHLNPQTPDAWQLVWGQPHIDSATLVAAIEAELQQNLHPDYRTRLLVRDAMKAIRSFWGARKFARWLNSSQVAECIRAILDEPLAEEGFPYIRRRLVNSIQSAQIEQIFTLLGQAVHERIEVYVAGSIPTLIKGLTARPTEDIDIVDEVPSEIRKQKAVLRKIQTDYGLNLGHVQSRYLPSGWQDRRQFLGDFGGLRVYLVDPYDIFVSKLSSKKEKHKDDLRVLATKLDKEIAKGRLLRDGQAFLTDPRQRPQIEENWRFIFQEPLFLERATENTQLPADSLSKKRKKRARKNNEVEEP